MSRVLYHKSCLLPCESSELNAATCLLPCLMVGLARALPGH